MSHDDYGIPFDQTDRVCFDDYGVPMERLVHLSRDDIVYRSPSYTQVAPSRISIKDEKSNSNNLPSTSNLPSTNTPVNNVKIDKTKVKD